MDKYSLISLLGALSQYRKKERFTSTPPTTNVPDTSVSVSEEGKKILGMSLAIFLVILGVSLLLFFVALILLINRAKYMPMWAIIASILSMLFVAGGPIITIVLCLVTGKPHDDYGPYQGNPYNRRSYTP